jgi:hypothetical protein
MLEDVLDGIGFGGLWRSSTFHVPNEQDRQCTALTDRLIEVWVYIPIVYEAHFSNLMIAAYHCMKLMDERQKLALTATFIFYV